MHPRPGCCSGLLVCATSGPGGKGPLLGGGFAVHLLGCRADPVGTPSPAEDPRAAGWGSSALAERAEALQRGVCILQALSWCSPGLWGAGLARARAQIGFQTGLSLFRSRCSRKQQPRWSEVEQDHGQPQSPCVFSIAGEAVRPRADCDLLWWDEPYNNKITSLPEGARHHVRPRPTGPHAEHPLSPPPRGVAGMRGHRTSVFMLCCSPLSPPMSCFFLV